MRQEFEMTQDEYATIIKACRPVAYMVFGGMVPRSPQENANSAWAALGTKRRFAHMTVQPVPGKSDRFFTAEATT